MLLASPSSSAHHIRILLRRMLPTLSLNRSLLILLSVDISTFCRCTLPHFTWRFGRLDIATHLRRIVDNRRGYGDGAETLTGGVLLATKAN